MIKQDSPPLTSHAGIQDMYPVDELLSEASQQQFIDEFIPVRNSVEAAFYETLDKDTTPNERARKFVMSIINPLVGRPVRNAEHIYETYGRLMRHAWLSISLGVYDKQTWAIDDPIQRLLHAQANTVDVAWHAAISDLQHRDSGFIVEIGTGRANSVVRLAKMLPHVKIISLTISPEQEQIASGIVREMGLDNVEVRLGDIFDPAVHRDLLGKADAVGAIEVSGHFPPERKKEGIKLFGDLLKPGAPLSMLNLALVKEMNNWEQNYYANQSWYFGWREIYEEALEASNTDLVAYVDYTDGAKQTFIDTAKVLSKRRDLLRDEFGWLLSLVWPLIPRLNTRMFNSVAYVHVLGRKRG